MEVIADRSYVGTIESYGEQSVSLTNPNAMFIEFLTGGSSNNDSGIAVDQAKAIGNPAVWTSATKICGHLGQMPLDAMKWTNRNSEESEIDRKHPANFILNYQFSDDVSADVGKETLALHSLLRGNGRALIVRNARYEVSELIIMNPDEVVTVGVRENDSPRMRKYHVWRDPISGKQYPYNDSEVFHIPGLTPDGFSGYDTVRTAGNSIGLSLIAEKKASRYLRNNSVPSIILEAPPGMFKKESDARDFLEGFRRAHSDENQGTAGLLRDGVKATVLAVNPQEAQMIEQRKFSREDMALLFGVEQMLGIDKSVSYNSEEQRSKAYRVNCLGRWMSRWTHECWRKLLSEQQKRSDSHYFAWNDEILMQATLAERYEGYSKAIASRIFSPNEVRKAEGYKPYAGGDKYENPNTNTSQPVTKQATTPPATQPQQATNAIRSRIEHIVGVEKKRLVQYAAGKNATGKIDKFYSGWGTTLGNIVRELGGDEMLTSEWIEQSRADILELSGTATAAEFPAKIAEHLSGWQDRINSLVNSITEMIA